MFHVAGRIDLLVNNAGISGPTAPVEAVDPSEWQKTLDVGLTGAFNDKVSRANHEGAVIRCHYQYCLECRPMGCPNRSPYVAAKWGLIGLTKTWAMELGPYKVRVNALCPASVDGERIEAVMARDAAARGVSVGEIRQSYERQSSLQSFTRVEDIASMVCYLASEAAVRISGQAIGLDGHTETLGNSLGEI